MISVLTAVTSENSIDFSSLFRRPLKLMNLVNVLDFSV